MIDCQEIHRSCEKCEYALKEYGHVYGCQIEEDEKAYVDEMIMLEEMAEQQEKSSPPKVS